MTDLLATIACLGVLAGFDLWLALRAILASRRQQRNPHLVEQQLGQARLTVDLVFEAASERMRSLAARRGEPDWKDW